MHDNIVEKTNAVQLIPENIYFGQECLNSINNNHLRRNQECYVYWHYI